MVGKEDSPTLINMDHSSLAGVPEGSPDRRREGGSLSKMLCQRRVAQSVMGGADLRVVTVGPPEPNLMIEHQAWGGSCGEVRQNAGSRNLLLSAIVVACVAEWDLGLCLPVPVCYLWRSRKKQGAGRKEGRKEERKGRGKGKGLVGRGVEGERGKRRHGERKIKRKGKWGEGSEEEERREKEGGGREEGARDRTVLASSGPVGRKFPKIWTAEFCPWF